MTDDVGELIQRLKGLGDPYDWSSNHAVALCEEAADALERLSAENERLRTSLEYLVICFESLCDDDYLPKHMLDDYIFWKARKALGRETKK